jgi:putative membrane protein
MWGNMMGWGGGWGGGAMFGISHLLWWGLAILAIVVSVRWLLRSERAGGVGGTDRALSILKERYSRGEIDKDEFDARRRDLG